MSYAQYMEGHSVEGARSIFERACRIHLPMKYGIHLQWASFEEKHGCLDSARAILSHLEDRIPGLAIVRLRRVGLERRNGNLQEAQRLLEEAVQIHAGTKLGGFYAVKLSRLILKLQRDPHKAKAVLSEAIKKDPDNPHLHMCLLETEMSTNDAEDAPLVCLEQALKSKLSKDSKRLLSQKRLEYLEDFGSSLSSWADAYNEHQTYLKTQRDDGKKDMVKEESDSVSEDCYPPGVLPPPTSLNPDVPPEDKSTKYALEPTANVSVFMNSTTVSSSKANTNTPTVEPYPSSNYCSPRPYFVPNRTYGPPQNVQMQPFFRNQFSAPRENPFSDFHQPIHTPPPQGPFSGPPGPFMDNFRMPFNMPPMFGYGPWFQNFGAQAWNGFFPPQ